MNSIYDMRIEFIKFHNQINGENLNCFKTEDSMKEMGGNSKYLTLLFLEEIS